MPGQANGVNRSSSGLPLRRTCGVRSVRAPHARPVRRMGPYTAVSGLLRPPGQPSGDWASSHRIALNRPCHRTASPRRNAEPPRSAPSDRRFAPDDPSGPAALDSARYRTASPRGSPIGPHRQRPLSHRIAQTQPDRPSPTPLSHRIAQTEPRATPSHPDRSKQRSRWLLTLGPADHPDRIGLLGSAPPDRAATPALAVGWRPRGSTDQLDRSRSALTDIAGARRAGDRICAPGCVG